MDLRADFFVHSDELPPVNEVSLYSPYPPNQEGKKMGKASEHTLTPV